MMVPINGELRIRINKRALGSHCLKAANFMGADKHLQVSQIHKNTRPLMTIPINGDLSNKYSDYYRF